MHSLNESRYFEEESTADERKLIKGIFVTNSNNECILYLYVNDSEKSVFRQKSLVKPGNKAAYYILQDMLYILARSTETHKKYILHV
jgi:hypothetical protein